MSHQQFHGSRIIYRVKGLIRLLRLLVDAQLHSLSRENCDLGHHHALRTISLSYLKTSEVIRKLVLPQGLRSRLKPCSYAIIMLFV